MGREEDERRMRREYRRIQRKKQERIRHLILAFLMAGALFILVCAVIVIVRLYVLRKPADPGSVVMPDYVRTNLLTPNPYSRPQTPLEEINGIVVHYVANPCSTARENRNYFEGLKDQTGKNTTSVSSHFVIGLEGEVVQCVPINEVAYASNHRNSDTISIECCHPDESGKFYDSTYQSLLDLCAFLCVEFHLEPEDVIRHYDVTGKACPKYFVDHPEEWDKFHDELKDRIREEKRSR